MNISPDAIANTWRYFPRKKTEVRGAQIDLLFDRNDDAITLCEIKYKEEAYVITKDYFEVLQRKIKVFKERTQIKKQIFMAMIAANGLKKTDYSEDIISGVVTLDDLFREVN